jgi:hypothetical protein
MKSIHPVLILLTIALFVAGGCYTVLRHPSTYDMTDDYGDKACADCHADADLYHYTEAYGGSWYLHYPAPWAFYYQSPWWYGDYWYYDPDTPGAPYPVELGGRHLWNRGGGLTPGPVPPQGEQQLPAVTGQQDRSDSRDTDKPVREEKEKKKKRTLWGR